MYYSLVFMNSNYTRSFHTSHKSVTVALNSVDISLVRMSRIFWNWKHRTFFWICTGIGSVFLIPKNIFVFRNTFRKENEIFADRNALWRKNLFRIWITLQKQKRRWENLIFLHSQTTSLLIVLSVLFSLQYTLSHRIVHPLIVRSMH